MHQYKEKDCYRDDENVQYGQKFYILKYFGRFHFWNEQENCYNPVAEIVRIKNGLTFEYRRTPIPCLINQKTHRQKDHRSPKLGRLIRSCDKNSKKYGWNREFLEPYKDFPKLRDSFFNRNWKKFRKTQWKQ